MTNNTERQGSNVETSVFDIVGHELCAFRRGDDFVVFFVDFSEGCVVELLEGLQFLDE